MRNNTWGTFVQHKRRVQQAKLLNFLNLFYFSAFRIYFTRVLDPHPNTPLMTCSAAVTCPHKWQGDCNLYRPKKIGIKINYRKHHVLNNIRCNTPHPSWISGAPFAFLVNQSLPCDQSVPRTQQHSWASLLLKVTSIKR